jgi:hypothetical protein
LKYFAKFPVILFIVNFLMLVKSRGAIWYC